MYPVVLDLTGRLALVVGGGAVGRRKAAGLLAAGARVRLVCLEPPPADGGAAGLDWRTCPYEPAHLDGVALAIAAAPAAVNQRVVADARRLGVWVADAADPPRGDFHTPAVLRRGGLLVAVSTGGAAPALAARLRDDLAAHVDAAYADWLALLAELRPVVLARVADEAARRRLLGEFADGRWLDRLRRDGVEAVRQAMGDLVAAAASGHAPLAPQPPLQADDDAERDEEGHQER